jgi:hypothetical protein
MKRYFKNGLLLTALLFLFVFACKSNRLENSKQNQPKSSYGLGFGDTSVHPPNDTTVPSHDTTHTQDNERLKFVIKNHDDSLKYWKQRCQLHLKETDSIFQRKVKELHLSRQDAQFIKDIIDSLNNLNKWEVEMWEHALIKDYNAYLKWSWEPNVKIRDKMEYYKKQLIEKKVQAKWNFEMKVYRLQGM